MKRLLLLLLLPLLILVGATQGPQGFSVSLYYTPYLYSPNGINVNTTTCRSTSGNSLQCNLPYAPLVGDVLVDHVCAADGTESQLNFPSGFTAYQSVASGTSGLKLSGAYHVVQTGDSTGPYTVTLTGPNSNVALAGEIDEYTGAQTVPNPITNTYAGTVTGSNQTLASIAFAPQVFDALPITASCVNSAGLVLKPYSSAWVPTSSMVTAGSPGIAFISQRALSVALNTVTPIAGGEIDNRSGSQTGLVEMDYIAPQQSVFTQTLVPSPSPSAGPISVNPTTLQFGSPSSANQSFVITDPNYSGSFTATSGATSVATVQVNGNIGTVTPIGSGNVTITVSDTSGNQSFLSVGVSVPPTPSPAPTPFYTSQYPGPLPTTLPNSATFQPTSGLTAEWCLGTGVIQSTMPAFVSYGPDLAPLYENYIGQAAAVGGSSPVNFYMQVKGTNGVTSGTQVFGTTILQLNTTYCSAATYDGSTLKLYVNGNIEGTVSAPGTIGGYTSTGGEIGAKSSLINPFNGFVWGVNLYNYARTQAQVQADYLSAPPSPTPSPAPTPTPAPSSTPTATPGPTPSSGLVKVWAYYGNGQSGFFNDAGSVPAATMAKYFVGVFCGGTSGGQDCIPFKNAGGMFYGAYDDVTFGQKCDLRNLSNIVCSTGGADDFWKSGLPASYYVQNSSGQILSASGTGCTTGCKIGMNNLNSPTISQWSTFLNTNAAYPVARGFNTEFSDDIMTNIGDYTATIGGGATSIDSNATLQAAMQNMLRQYPASVKPFINAGNSSAASTTNIQSVLLPGVLGVMWENCIQDNNNNNGDINDVVTDNYINSNKNFSSTLNILLYVQSKGKYSMCYAGSQNATGITQTGPRLYLAGAMWLIFDPTLTIVLPGYTKNVQTDASAVPEYQITIGAPVQNAGTAISNLKVTVSGGYVYRREFTGCTIPGPSGNVTANCAAVVNATNGTVSMPTTGNGLVNSYQHSYQFINTNTLINSSPGSGKFTAAIPGTLAGGTAVLLGNI